MYYICFYEEGAFVTRLGDPVRSLSRALEQIERLSADTGAEKLDDYVGVKWLRAGSTTCHIIVTDDFGGFIKTAALSEQEDL